MSKILTSQVEEVTPGQRDQRLLVSLGMLDAQLGTFLRRVDTVMPEIAPRLALEDVAQALLSAAVLGLRFFSDQSVQALMLQARTLCIDSVVQPREAARLAAFA